ncbi:MAG TPA: PQQ-binding-like beta-propeller repeat protein [Ktedonobacterales bacterium]
MREMWRFLTRQGPCPPLIALLLTCSVAACAIPFSNKDTPLAQNTPIVYGSSEEDGSLQALSGRDGSPLWRTAVGHSLTDSIIVGDMIYAVVFSAKTLKSSAIAVRLSDGKVLWQTAVPTTGTGPVLVSDSQNIIVDGIQAGLTGLDPADGAIRWSKQAKTDSRNMLRWGVLRRGVYYTTLPSDPNGPGGSTPALAAYRASDGSELWKVPITITVPLFANESTLFANSGNNTIVALSQEDGHQLWSKVYPAAPAGVVGVSPRMALVNEDDKPLDALDAMDGHVLWSAASADLSEVGVRDSTNSVTAVADLIVGPQDDTLIALHERDGTEAWRVQFQGFHYISELRVRDGVLFVILYQQSGFSSQYQIAALDAATGAVYWRVDAPVVQGFAQFSDAAP